MTYKPFDLEEAKAGKKFGVISSSGDFIECTEWRYFETASKDINKLVAVINGSWWSYNESGFSNCASVLVMKPEEKVFYSNVYKTCSGAAHESLEDAKEEADADSLGQIKITITGDDFTVEKV